VGAVGEMRGDGEAGIELRLLLIDSTRPGEAVYGTELDVTSLCAGFVESIPRLGDEAGLSPGSPRSRMGNCGSSSSSSASASSSHPV
jgi:hypothetical protein